MSDSAPANTPHRRLVSNTSVISAHKVAQIAGSLAAVVILPRLLGVEDYGRFSFVLSLTFLGAILADLGTLDVFGRFVPTMAPDEARKLYMRTLAFSLAASMLCFVATAAASMLLASWMIPLWALMAGLMVVLRVASWVPFQYALAQNRVGAWMTEQAWRQWVTLAALLALYPLLGFTGALLALVSAVLSTLDSATLSAATVTARNQGLVAELTSYCNEALHAANLYAAHREATDEQWTTFLARELLLYSDMGPATADPVCAT